MGNDVAEAVETLPHPSAIKVHRQMCTVLMKLVDRISKIFPDLEEARPRCTLGIQALCSLNAAMEKAKLLLQYCSESSKLYLAITGETIVLRFERSRNLLEQSLNQIQNMVPIILAVEISQILDGLRSATFILDSSEEEAGKVVRALLFQNIPQSDSIENSVTGALQFAASRLNITSKKALLIEKRSLTKLLDKVSDTDPRKKDILKHLRNLLLKYGKFILVKPTEDDSAQQEANSPRHAKFVEVESRVGFGKDEAQTDMFSRPTPPEEFICSLSLRLMYDPVVIASGQTFEKMWIQKWFDEGYSTCPKTKKILAHQSMNPNTAMKDLISKWCTEHGYTIADPCIQSPSVQSWETSSTSIVSFGSSMNDICPLAVDFSNVSLGDSDTSYISDSSHVKIKDGFDQMSMQTNDDSHKCLSYTDTNGRNSKFLSKLYSLPWESQQKVVEDVKNHLAYDNQACNYISSENFVEQLIRFLKHACDLHDVKAQKAGLQLLLALMNKSRNEIPCMLEDIVSLLESLLDSKVTGEALAVMVLLSDDKYCRSKILASGVLTSILKILDSQAREYQESAIKILYNMSSNSETRSHIVSLDCIPKLVPFMDDGPLAKYCIVILKNLSDIEEARVSIAETNGCIASIVELLDTGDYEDQEHAVAILLFLCSQRIQYCQLVMDEGVIPDLFNLSINGNEKAKMSATELLRLLRDIDYGDAQETAATELDDSRDSGNHFDEKKSTSKASGFFSRKISMFSKPKKKK